MADRWHRRAFLKVVVVPVAATAGMSLWGCDDDTAAPSDPDPGPDPATIFPQGIASGDPKPDSVVLWTRIAPPEDGSAVVVEYEVARDQAFAEVIANGEVDALAESDHTVRIKPLGLEPFTHYYYRFRSSGATSVIGRTKTAPTPDQDVPIRFAFASCQDYISRYYHAWRLLVDEEEPVDFVLFLGDYIYETTDNPLFQHPTPGREVVLPDGLALGQSTEENLAALTLDDYRTLYRTYRTDPDLQRAHQMFPFISTWDDHEFANDCWQDHSNHFDEARGPEQDPERRTAATQAWFEYLPVDVEHRPDLAFPADIKIWRSLRFGRHVDLVLTDQRYYRSDHVIPEGPPDLAVGKFREFSQLGSRTLAIKEAFDEREALALPTMLGEEQKQWLVETVSQSTATWKILGSQVQFAQMLLDLRGREEVPGLFQNVFYFKPDLWDGFRTERRQILDALAPVENLVVLSGDIHANYVAEVRPDYDDASTPATAVEYIVTGISSINLQEQVHLALTTDATLAPLELGVIADQFDTVLMESNPHFRYANSSAFGLAVVEVDRAAEVRVTFIEIDDVSSPQFVGAPRRLRFRTTAGSRQIEQLG